MQEGFKLIEKSAVARAIEECLKENKGKRKFTQSIDLTINFKDIDFKKPEERISLDVVLPNAPRKAKIAVFADGNLAFEAKKTVDLVISSSEIQGFAADKKKQKQLLEYTLLAEPSLMAVVGKLLGQVLGARGKLPKPILPGEKLSEIVEKTSRSVSLRTKGKYLPTLACIVGKESMSVEEITENILSVFEALSKKVSDAQIASAYVKTTMGKPVKIK